MRSLLLIVALLLSGCAQSINWNDPNAISSAILVEHDNFKKVTSFIGPNCALDQISDRLILRAWKTRNGGLEYQIYVSDQYAYAIARGGLGWRFYLEAFDLDGNRLATRLIARNGDWCGSNVCSYIETMGIDIGRDYLEE